VWTHAHCTDALYPQDGTQDHQPGVLFVSILFFKKVSFFKFSIKKLKKESIVD
jgi:hypothetical protein